MYSIVDMETFVELERFNSEYEAYAELQMILHEEPEANLAVFRFEDTE